jgi:enolase
LEAVRSELAPLVIGKDAADQRALDDAMRGLDGTDDKSRLGANAILSISLAAAKAETVERGLPMYAYLRGLIGADTHEAFPIPMFNILNGGQHSDSGLSVQEFKIVPAGLSGYPEMLRAGSEIFHMLKKILGKKGYAIGVGDEGGFAPHLPSHTEALALIGEAVTEAGYSFGKDVFIGLDVAANSFYEKISDRYRLEPEGEIMDRDGLIARYRRFIKEFGVVSIEDGLHEEDWDGWKTMREALDLDAAWGKPVMFIGDDLLVTNSARVEKGIAHSAMTAVLIKPNQIGTLTETLDCIALSKKNGLATVISHRSGETCDDFIADLAVGTDSQFIKTGSLSRGERLAKYNRLLQIHAELHQQ